MPENQPVLLFAKPIANKAFVFAVAAKIPKAVIFVVAVDNAFDIVNNSISCVVLLIIILSNSSFIVSLYITTNYI